MLSLTTTLLSLSLLYLVYTLYTYLTSPLRQIPGPFLASLTNYWRFLSVLQGKHHEVQRTLHDTYGPAVRLGPNCITVTDPSLIKVLYPLQKPRFIKSDYYKTSDFRHGKRILHSSVSYRDEEAHTKMVRPAARFYTTTGVLRYEDRLNDVVKLFLQQLETRFVRPGGREVVCPIDDWLHFCAWDLIAAITFSKDFGFLRRGEDVRGLIGQSCKSLDYMASVGQIPWLDDWVGKNYYIKFPVGTMIEGVKFAAEQLASRMRGEDKHDKETEPDLLDDFLALREEDPEITDDRLVQYAFRNVAAGSDTTATSLRAVVYYLCRYPETQKRLHEELEEVGVADAVRSGDALRYAELYKLPYLTAVIQEGFRIHPSVALSLERVVPDTGYVLPDGRYLPPGTIVGINPAVINRHKGVFGEDSDDFRPERWLKNDHESEDEYKARLGKMKDTDMTFGHGKRICAGRHVAVVEIYKVIASLFSAFDVRLVDPDKEWKTKNSFFNRQWDMDVYLTKRVS
ncbi:cytochrome P450 monooxygenase-like protein 16 [Elsinoe australis]|uniref:Cytochrome P450 monooxygenase-like protein 16 n=1 Tax=Elsinoe australis TaxID=40998 RepID=A0A4U7B730_9PEZI|nr:cytochrome P450 monooxygenase-like protein 16 [Elsinoe australis]